MPDISNSSPDIKKNCKYLWKNNAPKSCWINNLWRFHLKFMTLKSDGKHKRDAHEWEFERKRDKYKMNLNLIVVVIAGFFYILFCAITSILTYRSILSHHISKSCVQSLFCPSKWKMSLLTLVISLKRKEKIFHTEWNRISY